MDAMKPQAAQPNLNALQTPPPAPAEPSTTTVILGSVTVTGSILGRDDVLIEGTVVGDIQVEGSVTVAAGGMVKGPIQADAVIVAGAVEGNIAARTRIQLQMTGSIQGDVTTRSFTIEDGSYFNGRSHMTKPGEEPEFLYQP